MVDVRQLLVQKLFAPQMSSIRLLVGVVCCIFGNAAEIGVLYLL